MVSDSQQPSQWASLWRSLMRIFFAAGVLCLFSGFVLSCKGHQITRKKINPSGGMIGPFTIDSPKTPCRLKVSQALSYSGPNKWSWVQFELLDSEKEALFGVGDEVWAEHGYDSDGPWRERKSAYQANFIVRDPGTYYLQATTERSSAQIESPIMVTLRTGTVSSVPLTWGGILFLVLGIVSMVQYGKRTQQGVGGAQSGRESSFRIAEDDFDV